MNQSNDGKPQGANLGQLSENRNNTMSLAENPGISSTVNDALSYAARGIRVFPCKPDKRPWTEHGFKDATTDESQIRSWWSRHSDALIGLPTGDVSGIMVLDIDVKNGARGAESLQALVDRHGQLPPTGVVQTQSGGWHYYFVAAPGVRNSQGRIGPGIDMRAEGGYIIAPPSPGYAFIAGTENCPMASAPEWLVILATDQPEPQPESAAIIPVRNIPVGDALRRARAYLEAMPAAVSGSGGHDATYAAATALVHGFELTTDDALALLSNDYNPRCSPPWSESELRHKVQEASVKSHNQPKGWLLCAQPIVSVSPVAVTQSQSEAEHHLGVPISKCEPGHAAIVVGVLDRLHHHAVYVDALGSLRWVSTRQRSSVDVASLSTELAFDLRRDGQRVDTGRVVETAQVIIKRDADKRRQNLYSAILRQPSSDAGKTELRRWVRAVTGSEREADVQAVLHWLWLVKNRAAGRPGKMHLMLVLVGAVQGSGKSTAAAKLCAVWQELFDADISLESITDERCAPHLARCVAGLWDELGGLARADMERLKHRITAPDVSFRPMRTTDRVVLPSLMSLIGTSNRSMAELVKDGTGMRRFYELPVPGRCDWETLNAIDYTLLWSAISESEEAPGILHRDLLAVEQNKLTWRHPVERWLDEESWGGFTDPTGKAYGRIVPTVGALTVDLFQRFRLWCRDHGEREVRAEELGRQLTALGWEAYRSSRATGQKPSYRLRGIDTAHPARPAQPCTGGEINPPDPMVCSGVQGVQGERGLSAVTESRTGEDLR
jgi:Bifunctional DNA primase/polymerase, N-terminal/Virulence-associated protein E